MTTQDAALLQRIQYCRDHAIHTFATAWVFQKRARTLSRNLALLSYAGLVGTLVVGGLAVALGVTNSILPVLITAAGVWAVVIAALSLWSVIAKWPDQLTYAYESIADNNRLTAEFAKFWTEGPTMALGDLQQNITVLDARNAARMQQDIKQNVKDKELREGMRAALRQYQFPCAGCETVPKDMQPTDCPVCGNF